MDKEGVYFPAFVLWLISGKAHEVSVQDYQKALLKQGAAKWIK